MIEALEDRQMRIYYVIHTHSAWIELHCRGYK